MKLSELARLTGARVEGATEEIEITGAAGLDEASEGHVTFLANPRYTPRVNTTRAPAIYLSEDTKIEKQIAILRVKDPYLAYTRALRIFHPDAELEPFIHPSAVIDPSARIAARVAIGAGTTIDRASVGESRIGRGSKLDNLVQVGHSCTIGEDALLCAQVGLAGSSHIGSRVILAGQTGVAGHLTIGDDVVLTAKSATSHDIPAGKVISGIPAFDNRDWLRATAAFRRLGEIQRTVRELERRIKAADVAG